MSSGHGRVLGMSYLVASVAGVVLAMARFSPARRRCEAPPSQGQTGSFSRAGDPLAAEPAASI